MTYDTRLLLVKAITLLFRESSLPDEISNSADLVRTVLEPVKPPETGLTISSERDVITALKDTALYLCSLPLGSMIEKSDLLQRLKLNCTNDERLYEVLMQGIDKEMDIGSTKRTVLQMRQYLNDSYRDNQIIKKFNDANKKLLFNRHEIKDMRAFVQAFHTETEPYTIVANRKDPGIVDQVDLGDDAKLTQVCQTVQEQASGETVIRFGWSGLNEMLQGGGRRGECGGIQALQHNYKTGFSLTIFRQAASYNEPVIAEEARKPLLLRISFEDSLQSNIQFLFQNIYENENGGITPDLSKFTAAEMAAYVKLHLQKKGWHVHLMRVNPSEWTFKDIQNTVLNFEAAGYEVHMLMVDYLPMIPTTGCDQGPAGHDYRDLLRRMRNFCSSRKILFITPWQMSTDAKMLLREGRSDFVKNVVGKGYYSGSKQVDQEFDWELTIHIEQFNGQAWLTVGRGKHRLPTTIPDPQKFFAMPFPEKGSIPDDLDKPRICRRKIGGGPIGSAEETPFHDFDE